MHVAEHDDGDAFGEPTLLIVIFSMIRIPEPYDFLTLLATYMHINYDHSFAYSFNQTR